MIERILMLLGLFVLVGVLAVPALLFAAAWMQGQFDTHSEQNDYDPTNGPS
jgi:hypothetical protein